MIHIIYVTVFTFNCNEMVAYSSQICPIQGFFCRNKWKTVNYIVVINCFKCIINVGCLMNCTRDIFFSPNKTFRWKNER
jgi:hypothetical protein